MEIQAYIIVLKEINKRLSGENIDWALTGSLSFALQGMETNVHDIDLQTSAEGAYHIEKLFSEFIQKEVTWLESEKICSHFGILQIKGIKVEIMGALRKKLSDGNWEAPVDIREHRRYIQIDELSVPVLSLSYESEAYLKIGRTEKAERLKKFILETRGSRF